MAEDGDEKAADTKFVAVEVGHNIDTLLDWVGDLRSHKAGGGDKKAAKPRPSYVEVDYFCIDFFC